ncbi:PadR family transcriptional regulator [Bacillus aquiflavi]|uniref:PadR family transcriptional regulator n=2 Tax=Bacillus aquiflavi TaxID=2672567 RepID=A0A6B3W3T3_9BACI|nr:PadR family transcriptional regulator [Bacillus aquiflavi]NEY83157.1 PadR family transcriptional regulator [Bacillus aquiflavi]UAC50154.1 PadR family transcriptional regulator [Bacillus aquiflavi]
MEDRYLILLGILMVQSQHGYQINEFIELNLYHITDMKKATAYKMLERLNKKGYIDIEIEEQENRPNRKVYSVNHAGKEYFFKLLRKNLSSNEVVNDPANIGLMFIDYLPLEESISCLEKRLAQLKRQISTHKQFPSHRNINGVSLAFERTAAILKADVEWHENTIQALKIKLKNE